MSAPLTLFDKIWDRVCVTTRKDGYSLLYIDRHIGHDGTVGGFNALRERGLSLRRPDLTFASVDHFVSTTGPTLDDISNPTFRKLVSQFNVDAAEFGHTAFALGDERRGIVHVVGPEQGITQPGLLMVCGDSHTSTHGAFGAFAFGIGSTELVHVLSTQTLWQRKPKSMRVNIQGARAPGVTAKDLILAVIAQIGANGATGHVIEYAGEAIAAMSMEERMTVCNMSIEAGARAGIIAPDERTFAYLEGRPYAPRPAHWDRAVAYWRTLPSDVGAVFDREVDFDASALVPFITWGTSPQDGAPIDGNVPDPQAEVDPQRRQELQSALHYMGLEAGMPINEIEVDHVFIGSCTNGRIDDLRAAAAVLEGRKVKISGLVVPGSTLVKKQAEVEGLDQIFLDAGLEWRESGCSMCCSFNGDMGEPGERWASTSNRNFVGRQGPRVRTHLVSPAMAAAAAVTGRFTDVRALGTDEL